MGARRRGFTLIEMIVVIGILVVLATILLPLISKARKQAQRVQVRATLVAIEMALEEYRKDNREYPRVLGNPNANNRGYDGAVVLWRALLGTAAQRGVTGTKPTYINSEDFPAQKLPSSEDRVILDGFGTPILYYPASMANVNPRVVFPGEPHPYVCYISDVKVMFDIRDNTGPVQPTEEWEASLYRPGDSPSQTGAVLLRLRKLLGDTHGPGNPTTLPDGLIQPDETPVDKPFALCSAGPDGRFGPDRDLARCDDVTNFR